MEISETKISVIIADNQFLIVESLKLLFQNDVKYLLAGVATTKQQLEKLLEQTQKVLLITDNAAMDFDGSETLKQLKQRFPLMQVLILTYSINRLELIELTKAGFNNVISKTADHDEIVAAIEATLKRKKYFSSELLDLLLDQNENLLQMGESKNLTVSEKEIVKLIANGNTTKEIAVQKHISFHTVNTHRKNIFRKLDVSSSSELIMHAIKSGWIDNIEYYI